jgi:carbamoyl-phosphate synthase large subunit
MVVKGIFYGAKIVLNSEEAAKAFRNIASKWGLPVLVQQFIKGEEYNLAAVGDGKGNLLSPVMMKKLALTDKGKAWAGVSMFDQTLLDAAEALCKAIKWRGPLEVEVMKTDKGQYQLIEINPRFPAWIYLSTGVGSNLPEVLVELAFSKKMSDRLPAQVGKIFIRYAEEFIIDMKDFEAIIMHGDSNTDDNKE